jgi:hypothetical protein
VVPGTGTVTFKYDPFGHRIQKSSPLGTTNYLYDGFNDVEEVDNSGNLLVRYAQGASVDEELSELRRFLGSEGSPTILGICQKWDNPRDPRERVANPTAILRFQWAIFSSRQSMRNCAPGGSFGILDRHRR